MPPTPGLRGQWNSPGSPAGFLGPSGWGKHPPLLSCSSGCRGALPPASPFLPLASFLCPQDQCGHGEWGPFEGRGLAWELSSLLVPKSVGQMPSAPPPLLPEGPSHVPFLISPASGVLILSGLHFSSPLSPPTSYQFTWGFLPSPWALESSTSGRQGT